MKDKDLFFTGLNNIIKNLFLQVPTAWTRSVPIICACLILGSAIAYPTKQVDWMRGYSYSAGSPIWGSRFESRHDNLWKPLGE